MLYDTDPCVLGTTAIINKYIFSGTNPRVQLDDAPLRVRRVVRGDQFNVRPRILFPYMKVNDVELPAYSLIGNSDYYCIEYPASDANPTTYPLCEFTTELGPGTQGLTFETDPQDVTGLTNGETVIGIGVDIPF